MTDAKVKPRLSYCLERQPRLPDCQSVLVGAGSKLSSQHFGLALHNRSLEHCRLWVLAGAITHTFTNTVKMYVLFALVLPHIYILLLMG